jgi:Fe-S-cluster containining protein
MADIRFACQPGCVNCCNVRGWVYLTEEDLVRAAAYVNLPPAEFEAKYVVRTRHLLRLRKPMDQQCPFLLGNGCSIHPAKPTQCRVFPFWPELVENRGEWQATADYCPGIGKGELYQIGTALELGSEMKRAYPTMYKPVRRRS